MTQQEVYRQLPTVMKKRGGGYSGMDIPEFYAMAKELFTPEEAEVNNAMPRGPFKDKDLALGEMGREEVQMEQAPGVHGRQGTLYGSPDERGPVLPRSPIHARDTGISIHAGRIDRTGQEARPAHPRL